MNQEDVRKMLELVATGALKIDEAVDALRDMPFITIGDVSWDTHRQLRRGIAESIFGPGKTDVQIADALTAAARSGAPCVVTRVDSEKASAALRLFAQTSPASNARFDPVARVILLESPHKPGPGRGTVVVMTAGTSDVPVAEEAAVTLEISGNDVVRIRDVGVAGIHRLAPHLKTIRNAVAVIVVAGMEGALPSVVAGLTPAPVIGVPTSVGYGTAFGGVTALLSMLNSCSGGVTVVNIDNGYGAAVAAHLINADRKAEVRNQ